MASIKILKPAATVIVAKPMISTEGKSNFEILMVKRTNKARFMPGAHVFPGGILEKIDCDLRWKGLIGSSTPPFPTELIKMVKDESETSDKDPGVMEELYFKIAAIREVFEESNVLIAKNNKKQFDNLSKWRSDVQNDNTKFFDMCLTLGFVPNTENLYPWAHWVTPLAEKYRYNTLFFLAILKSSSTTILHDNKETTSTGWFSPDQALIGHEKGSIFLPPPTWFMINELSRYRSIEGLIESGNKRKFGNTIKPICPLFEIPTEEEKKKINLHKGQKIVSFVSLPGDAFVADIIEGKKTAPVSIVITADSNNPTSESWKYLLHQKTSLCKL